MLFKKPENCLCKLIMVVVITPFRACLVLSWVTNVSCVKPVCVSQCRVRAQVSCVRPACTTLLGVHTPAHPVMGLGMQSCCSLAACGLMDLAAGAFSGGECQWEQTLGWEEAVQEFSLWCFVAESHLREPKQPESSPTRPEGWIKVAAAPVCAAHVICSSWYWLYRIVFTVDEILFGTLEKLPPFLMLWSLPQQHWGFSL